MRPSSVGTLQSKLRGHSFWAWAPRRHVRCPVLERRHPSPAFQALSGSVSAGNVLARSRAARCGDIRSTSFTWRVASMRSQPLRAVTTRASTRATERILTADEQEWEGVLEEMESEKLYGLGSKEVELS